MTFRWPHEIKRIPDEAWTTKDVDASALGYDAVKHHGWYENLGPTLNQLIRDLADGQWVLDYSGGTGIMAERLFNQRPGLRIGWVIVDSSPKFLRLALEKFHADQRVGFRLIQFLKDRKRLQFVDEVLDAHFDVVVSTNAIHLYYDLQETLKSWFRVLRPGSKVFVQSGNIRNPEAKQGEWIIDETVDAIHEAAIRIVSHDDRFSSYRETLKDQRKMAAYAALREKYFLPARPLQHYIKELRDAGFVNVSVSSKTIEVQVNEWHDFLSVYHDGILGWIGGTEKVEGRHPAPASIRDRLILMREAMEKVFPKARVFVCCWSYMNCRVP